MIGTFPENRFVHLARGRSADLERAEGEWLSGVLANQSIARLAPNFGGDMAVTCQCGRLHLSLKVVKLGLVRSLSGLGKRLGGLASFGGGLRESVSPQGSGRPVMVATRRNTRRTINEGSGIFCRASARWRRRCCWRRRFCQADGPAMAQVRWCRRARFAMGGSLSMANVRQVRKTAKN